MALELKDILLQVAAGLIVSEGAEQEIWKYADTGQANVQVVIPFTLTALTAFDLSSYVDADQPWICIVVDDDGEDSLVDHRIQVGLDPLGDGYYLPIAPGKFAVFSGNTVPVRGVPLYLNNNTASVVGRIILIGTKT